MITPEKAVSVISGLFGNPPKVRVLHAKGFVCQGSFVATPQAAALTRAAHFQGQPVDTTIRLSNGSGRPDEKDYAPGVRGLAVAFDLGAAGRPVISCQTLPEFTLPSSDAFVAFLRASTPGVHQLWAAPAFLVRYPTVLKHLKPMVKHLSPTVSYATDRYYAIHAYTWVAADGSTRSIRYRWEPQAGVQRTTPKAAKPQGPNYLEAEFRQRLSAGPVTFDLHVQIAGPGDDPDDPSSRWNSTDDVHVGTLEIREPVPEPEVLVFDPTAIVDGIELSGDPILRFRGEAYTHSVNHRLT